MRMKAEEAEDLLSRVKPGQDGRYKKEPFIQVLTR